MVLKETVKEVILTGVPRTESAVVKNVDVKRGMILQRTDADQVEPATDGERPIGIALWDADVDERVTYALLGSDFTARVLLAESQTVEEGDALGIGASAISGVDYLGEVAKVTDQTFTALGATGTEVEGLVAQIRGHVGFALEDKSTDTDEIKVIKVEFRAVGI